MGEGIFGFELPGGGGFGPTGYGGFGLPDPFQPASGRTAIRCDLSQRDVENTARAAGIPGLLNLAEVLSRYGGLDGNCDVRQRIAAAGLALGGGMGFLDVLNNIGTGIRDVVGGVISAIPTVVDATAVVVGGINRIQDIVNGNVSTTTAAMPAAMPSQPMSSSMVNGNTGASGQAAFEMACRADPACTAAVVAALQAGGTPMMGMMNGSTAAEDAQLAALGFPAGVIMALRAVPGAIGRILGSPAGQIAVGVGGGLVGTAIGTAALMGGAMSGMRLPRRIQVPDGKGGVREYVSRGRPILYSGDISALRRVSKVRSKIPRGRRLPRQKPLLITAGTRNVCGKCLTAPCGCNGG